MTNKDLINHCNYYCDNFKNCFGCPNEKICTVFINRYGYTPYGNENNDVYTDEVIVDEEDCAIREAALNEYRDCILKFWKLDSAEREKIFGVNYGLFDGLENVPPQDFISKIKMNKNNLPKKGEVWQERNKGYKVIIIDVNEYVKYFSVYGRQVLSVENFVKYHKKTYRVCENVDEIISILNL